MSKDTTTTLTTAAATADTATLKTIPADAAALHAARLKALMGGAQVRGLQLKLLMYFAGLEAVSLRDCFTAEHGETRGRKNNNSHVRTISLSDWFKAKLGAPLASVYRHIATYEALATAKPEIAEKLNAMYRKQVDALALDAPKGKGAATAPAEAVLSLGDPAACKLSAALLQELAESADGLGLESLFAKPADSEDDHDDAEDGSTGRKVKPEVKFWLGVFPRMEEGEFLRLPKPQLRRFVETAKEAVKKAEDALNGKSPKA